MIVNHTDSPAVLRTPDGPPHSTWRCLARRGMLHSETEIVDHLRVAPHDSLPHHADDVVEEALYVVAGGGEVVVGERALPVRPGHAVLLGPDETARLVAGPEGVELISLRTMPLRVSSALPPRVPELVEAHR
ncbi:hypothetical protein ACRAKI_20815 [Saccharothrix isguenensis]